MKITRRIQAVAISIFFLSIPAFSGTIASLRGNFDGPNQVLLVPVTLTATSTLMIQTYGYGGSSNASNGKNLAGFVILPGGFDPSVFLIDGSGNEIAENDDGACPPGANDPTTHLCLDATLTRTLTTGSYQVAMVAFHNDLNTPNLSGGWNNHGDFNGRSSAYSLDIASLDIASIPEPGSAALALIGAVLILIWRKRCEP